MSDLQRIIGRMKRLRDELSSPAEFFAEHRGPWLSLAQTIVRQVLTNLRPGEVPPDAWARQVEQTAQHVVLRPDGGDGVAIELAERGADAPQETGDVMQRTGFTVDEVRGWVAAGRVGGDTLGKRLDERDDGKSDLQIAWRILYALKLNNSGAGGLRAAIEKYLGRQLGVDAEQFYPAIEAAWRDVFAARVLEDRQQWVRRKLGEKSA